MQFIDQTSWKLSSLKNGSYYTRYINEKRPKIGRKQLFVSYYQCLQRLKNKKGHWFEIFIFAIKSSRYCRLVLSSDIFSMSAALEWDAFNNPLILVAPDSKKWRLNCYG
jgi:hypothetical protein